jgi:hypothetical protein
MKKLFAMIALVAFFGAIASPAIAAVYSTPIAVKVNDDKPKKAKATTETTKKDAKAECPAAKKGCSESKKDCSGTKSDSKVKEEVKK